MKRFESGYEMKIVMKPDASEKQLEIARKLYPKALVLRGLEAAKIDFKHCERFTKLLKEMADQEDEVLIARNITFYEVIEIISNLSAVKRIHEADHQELTNLYEKILKGKKTVTTIAGVDILNPHDDEVVSLDGVDIIPQKFISKYEISNILFKKREEIESYILKLKRILNTDIPALLDAGKFDEVIRMYGNNPSTNQ